jgi:hypothetical protein
VVCSKPWLNPIARVFTRQSPAFIRIASFRIFCIKEQLCRTSRKNPLPSWRLASGVWRLASGVWRLASGGLVLAALSACGGGGGGTSAGTVSQPITSATGEFINGIAVPAAPANPTAIVAGVDTNANGLRDDVERALATKLGSSPVAYKKAIATAKQLQSALASGSGIAAAQAVQDFITQTACATGEEAVGAKTAQIEMLNNRQRQKAMVDAYVAAADSSASAGLNTPACQ